MADRYSAKDYLSSTSGYRKPGGWRSLYKQFIDALQPASIVELGAGEPSFLTSVNVADRTAVDVSDFYAADFERAGVKFLKKDLDREEVFDPGGAYDVIICSDVFEHLLNPANVLADISAHLTADGVLISHVPNEFTFKRTMGMMAGISTSNYHPEEEEWNCQHFRRFTDVGFRRFLGNEFEYMVKITDLRYLGVAKILRALHSKVPYCLEGGPTYLATNNQGVFDRLQSIKALIRRGGGR